MIITFCGHSQFCSTGEYEKRLLEILEEIIGNEHAELYFGGYGEFDAFAYRCGKKYKQTHPNVSLVFVTPYMTLEHQKKHSEYQNGKYDAIIYPPIEHVPPRFAIIHRNKYMVEKADAVIAYVNRKYGGAYQAYLHAKRKKKVLFNLGTME